MTKNDTAVERRDGSDGTTRPLQTVVPVADIRETSEAYELDIDMPGVDARSVDITFENDVLAVEGQWGVEAPEGHELLEGLTTARRYRRTFAVSDRVDPENIKARVDNGVLHLALPKREEVRRRKIEITA